IALVALLAATAIHAASATAAPSFNGIVLDARLITVNTATASVTVRIDPNPGGSFGQPPLDLLTKDVVLYTSTVNGSLAHSYRAAAVTRVPRRRRFEEGFTGFLAVLLFAFPTVRNSLPGIPPVGVLLDYAAFFWAEALVALALIVLITGWTLRAPAGTTERRN